MRILKTLMLGRDSRTLFKLFEDIVYTPVGNRDLLKRANEILNTEQKKFIDGLKY